MSAASLSTRDVAVIGAGPCGLFSVFACGMMRLSCHVIDVLGQPGGQCQELYPEKPIYDVPAFPSITGQGLTGQLLAQIEPFKPLWHLGQMVQAIEPCAEGWQLQTTQKTLKAKAIIIAAGAGAFTPHKPPLEKLDCFEDKSVFYAVVQKEKFAQKNVVVAGGGDSAVDWALDLLDVAQSITLVHRRATLRAAPESVQKFDEAVAKGRIVKEAPYQLKALEGCFETGRLAHVAIASLKGDEKKLKADVLLPFFGLKSTLGPMFNWGLRIEKNRVCIDPTTAATSLSGVHAVGDVALYPFKRKLILSGFAEAAQAASAIRRQLFPDEVASFGHSTSSGVPSLGQSGTEG